MTSYSIFIYLGLQIALGLYLSRFIKDEEDFFLGGRKLPTFAIALSIFATWFGSETCIGSSAAVFSSGLSGSKAEPFGYGLCLVLTACFVAPKIWNDRYTTLGDFIEDKYSSGVKELFIWIVLPSSLIWAAAQLKAFGQVLTVSSGMSLESAMTTASVFVIVYSFLGGFIGDVVTDVIQGGFLAIGLLVVAYFAFKSSDVSWAKVAPERLSFISDEGSLLERLDSWLIPIFGSLISQELIARVLSSKNPSQASRASYWGAGVYFFFGSIPIMLGIFGDQFGLQIQESEQFLPTLAKTTLPNWGFVLFAGALISAILSTIDSILLASSALISHNILVPKFNLKSNKQKVLSARLVLICFGIITYLLALFGDSIYEMVELASSFGTTGVLVVTIGGLFHTRANGLVAVMTLLLGLVLSIVMGLILKIDAAFTLNLMIVSVFYFTGLYIQKKASLRPSSSSSS